jgi:xanthine dehydrogenase accessory factor
MTPELLERLIAARRERRPVALVTWLDQRLQLLLPDDASDRTDAALLEAVDAAIASDVARVLESEAGEIFVHPFNPSLRMILVGAVHIAQSLASMAARCGYEVTVVDPRGAFATEARFPEVSRSSAWPDDFMKTVQLDRRCAVVALTHDPKLDDPALSAALASDAFYIGALGSRKTHAGRLDRLRARGIGDDVLARIHGPVGLNIGARSPAEIAISILGQVTKSLRTGDT